MALTEVDCLVSVVSTWLVNTGGSSLIRALIHCSLHLVEEVIDVEQVTLRFQIWHRKRVVWLRHRRNLWTTVAIHCHHRLRWHVINQGTAGDWKSVERHQTLADLWVGSWIDLTTLGIAEEVVQDIETTLSLIVIDSRGVVTNVGGVMLNWVVAHAISLRLLWLVVTVV